MPSSPVCNSLFKNISTAADALYWFVNDMANIIRKRMYVTVTHCLITLLVLFQVKIPVAWYG
jgi:hypothetical protein